MSTKLSAKTEVRNVNIDYAATPLAAPIDFYKAVINSVEKYESAYQLDPSLTDLTDVEVLLVGANRNQIHVCQVTIDISAGAYTYDYTETVATAADKS